MEAPKLCVNLLWSWWALYYPRAIPSTLNQNSGWWETTILNGATGDWWLGQSLPCGYRKRSIDCGNPHGHLFNHCKFIAHGASKLHQVVKGFWKQVQVCSTYLCARKDPLTPTGRTHLLLHWIDVKAKHSCRGSTLLTLVSLQNQCWRNPTWVQAVCQILQGSSKVNRTSSDVSSCLACVADAAVNAT